MDIKVKKIKPLRVAVFGPDGVRVGKLNEYEFADLRLQIIRESAVGWRVWYGGRFYDVDVMGVIVDWPEGLFDMLMKTMGDIVRAQCAVKLNS